MTTVRSALCVVYGMQQRLGISGCTRLGHKRVRAGKGERSTVRVNVLYTARGGPHRGSEPMVPRCAPPRV